MAWRNQTNHKEETKAVKKALADAGIEAKVTHGRGTAWGWLHINIGGWVDMRAKTKFIITFVLVPIIFPIVSFFVGIYYKIMLAIAIILLGCVVYTILVLKYGTEIVVGLIEEK